MCLVFSEASHGKNQISASLLCKKLVGSSPSTEFHLKAISNDLMIQLLNAIEILHSYIPEAAFGLPGSGLL